MKMIMGRFWRQRGRSQGRCFRGKPDPERFFAELAAAELGPRYTEMDRYRDFRRVFLGSAEGKRVLYQLFEWGHLFRSSYVAGDAYATHLQEGERNIGLKVFAALNAEPAERPEVAETSGPEEL